MSKARELAELGAAYDSGALSNRNMIINGAMLVDQRNSGASATASANDHFIADRFKLQDYSDATFSAQQVADAPAGFKNSSKITVTGTDTSLSASQYQRFIQPIEGLNISQLNWGSANAKTVTLSFHVKSSLTGAFYVHAFNGAANRSFVSKYTIDTANTWEKKTFTITGDTTGTWLTTNGAGIYLGWSLGTGTNFQTSNLDSFQGAFDMAGSDQVNVSATNSSTWQVTGVQLEVGTEATPFEHRSFGQELALCQRYYQQLDGDMFAYRYRATYIMNEIVLRTQMRAAPTFAFTGNGTATADWTAHNLTVDKVAAYVSIAASDDTNRYISALKISAEL